MANSVDPDQMPHSVASDLGLRCLLSLSVSLLRVITVFVYAVRYSQRPKVIPQKYFLIDFNAF